jgi:hypothetical protein
VDSMRPTLPVTLSIRKQPSIVPDPGQRVRLRAGNGPWREGFRAVSEPYTAEAGEVMVWVAKEGEYWEAIREGRRAVGIPWPVQQMRVIILSFTEEELRPASGGTQEGPEPRSWWKKVFRG